MAEKPAKSKTNTNASKTKILLVIPIKPKCQNENMLPPPSFTRTRSSTGASSVATDARGGRHRTHATFGWSQKACRELGQSHCSRSKTKPDIGWNLSVMLLSSEKRYYFHCLIFHFCDSLHNQNHLSGPQHPQDAEWDNWRIQEKSGRHLRSCQMLPKTSSKTRHQKWRFQACQVTHNFIRNQW